MTSLLAVVRAIHFASLMAIFGGATYGLLLRRARFPGLPAKPTGVSFVVASSLALVTAILWFCLIAGQMSGDWRGSIDPATLELAAFATRFGLIFMVRIVGLAALWFICLFATRRHVQGVSILAGLLLVSLAPIGHAAAAAGGKVSIDGALYDAMHLLAAGFWLGGLMILAMLVPRHWTDPTTLAGPVGLFSTWGSFAVALLVITGVINAVSILPRAAWSFHNTYFALLSVKVALALAMVGLAALNRWRFAPAISTGGSGAVRRLAGSIGIEIVFGLTIVFIVGYLGLTAPH